jgi:hypothetical protein
MKYFLIVLVLSGCTYNINPDVLNKCSQVCTYNGGVEKLRVGIISRDVCFCQNGGIFPNLEATK